MQIFRTVVMPLLLANLMTVPFDRTAFASENSPPIQIRTLKPIHGLPVAVARKRQEIFKAAVSGDIRELARLASKLGFKFGFDEHGTFLHYLESGERAPESVSDKPLYRLRKLLNGPWDSGMLSGSNRLTYTWYEFDPKTLPADRFYYGYYVTISQDGEWTAFGLSD